MFFFSVLPHIYLDDYCSVIGYRIGGIVLVLYYCIVLCCCVVLCCVALRCAALRCDAMRCAALRCDAMRCDAMRCVALCNIVLYSCIVLCNIVLHWFASQVHALLSIFGIYLVIYWQNYIYYALKWINFSINIKK